MTAARDLLQRAEREGVRLEASEGRLRLTATSKPADDLLAELDAHKPELLELLAADDADAFEERAAIIEDDGGAPREWAEGFARLDMAQPADGFTPRRWQQLIDDGGRFLHRWAAEAAALGWSAADVFGVHPAALAARYDCMGLVPLIGGGEVVSIAADRAVIRMPTGGELTYCRRPRPGAVAVWEAARPGEM